MSKKISRRDINLWTDKVRQICCSSSIHNVSTAAEECIFVLVVVIWIVIPHSLVGRYQHFEGRCCLQLQGWSLRWGVGLCKHVARWVVSQTRNGWGNGAQSRPVHEQEMDWRGPFACLPFMLAKTGPHFLIPTISAACLSHRNDCTPYISQVWRWRRHVPVDYNLCGHLGGTFRAYIGIMFRDWDGVVLKWHAVISNIDACVTDDRIQNLNAQLCMQNSSAAYI
jgi:hypothetical protein